MGFQKNQVYTTHGAADEVRHWANAAVATSADKYVCKDGPVFRCDQLDRAARRVLIEVTHAWKNMVHVFLMGKQYEVPARP